MTDVENQRDERCGCEFPARQGREHRQCNQLLQHVVGASGDDSSQSDRESWSRNNQRRDGLEHFDDRPLRRIAEPLKEEGHHKQTDRQHGAAEFQPDAQPLAAREDRLQPPLQLGRSRGGQRTDAYAHGAASASETRIRTSPGRVFGVRR